MKMSKSQQQVEYFRKTCSVCCAVYLSLQGRALPTSY
uniref:Uncharacterized protein n=1 Tax=Anguilla anguilla TaxID=7936 RepID=A0A0E9ULV7_ANGAN